MSKDVGSGNGAFIGSQLAMSELEKSVPDWKHTGGGHFSHPEHGTVSVTKQPSGEFHVKHGGALANFGGKKAIFGSAHEAGAHAGEYMRGVSSRKITPPQMHNRPSPQMPKMNKALDAGSMMAAPGALTGGAALGRESLDGKMKKVGKSKWLARAEEAYKTWEKREQFEVFMKSKMPHLTKGEIQAIGQTLALKKSLEAEERMAKYASYYLKNEVEKGSDAMMANEKGENK